MTTEEYEQMKTSIAKLLERAKEAEQKLAGLLKLIALIGDKK